MQKKTLKNKNKSGKEQKETTQAGISWRKNKCKRKKTEGRRQQRRSSRACMQKIQMYLKQMNDLDTTRHLTDTMLEQSTKHHDDKQKQPRTQHTRSRDTKGDKRKHELFYFPALGHRPVPENKMIVFSARSFRYFWCL